MHLGDRFDDDRFLNWFLGLRAIYCKLHVALLCSTAKAEDCYTLRAVRVDPLVASFPLCA